MQRFIDVLETIGDICLILLCIIGLIVFITHDIESEYLIFIIGGIFFSVWDILRIRRKRRPYKVATKLPKQVKCPECGREVDLDENEMKSKKFTCPWCNKLIDFS